MSLVLCVFILSLPTFLTSLTFRELCQLLLTHQEVSRLGWLAVLKNIRTLPGVTMNDFHSFVVAADNNGNLKNIWAAIKPLNQYVQKIYLLGCTNITDTAVVALAEHCPSIQTIDLSGCTNITDTAVVALARLHPPSRLHELTCNKSTTIRVVDV